MKLLQINIEYFGKLSGYRWELNDGLNTLCRDNGFGKSTLAAFIKAMLYGIESNRRQSLLDNPRKRYTPWQGGHFGGWMIYSADGKEYKVERSFGSKASLDTVTVIDLKTGKALYFSKFHRGILQRAYRTRDRTHRRRFLILTDLL